MKLSIVAATAKEVEPLLDWHAHKGADPSLDVTITGVGIMHTMYVLSRKFALAKPDIAIQVGVGGSMDPIFKPGAVAVIADEVVGDSGVIENGVFKDLFDLRLALPDEFPYHARMLPNPHRDLMSRTKLLHARGITINEISTNPDRIRELKEKFDPFIESMEGAAFHYVCLKEDIPFLQIRAISNWVGERDKSNWRMQEAITQLNNELIRLIEDLTQ